MSVRSAQGDDTCGTVDVGDCVDREDSGEHFGVCLNNHGGLRNLASRLSHACFLELFHNYSQRRQVDIFQYIDIRGKFYQ